MQGPRASLRVVYTPDFERSPCFFVSPTIAARTASIFCLSRTLAINRSAGTLALVTSAGRDHDKRGAALPVDAEQHLTGSLGRQAIKIRHRGDRLPVDALDDIPRL